MISELNFIFLVCLFVCSGTRTKISKSTTIDFTPIIGRVYRPEKNAKFETAYQSNRKRNGYLFADWWVFCANFSSPDNGITKNHDCSKCKTKTIDEGKILCSKCNQSTHGFG